MPLVAKYPLKRLPVVGDRIKRYDRWYVCEEVIETPWFVRLRLVRNNKSHLITARIDGVWSKHLYTEWVEYEGSDRTGRVNAGVFEVRGFI